MNIQDFLDSHFNGNASAAARALGVTPGAVAQWKTNGVSPLRQAQIELWLLKNTQPGQGNAGSPAQSS